MTEQLPGSPLADLPLSERKQQFSLGFVRIVAATAGYSVKEHTTDYDGVDMALARVHERLVQGEEPPHRETLFGQVISLIRDEDGLGADETGSVVLSAEVNGRKRNVHMTLTGDQHNHAIASYQLKLPLVVTGDLVFERRAWRLTGDVEVDPSFLERGRSSN